MFDGYISGNGSHIMFKGKDIYERNISYDMLVSLKNWGKADAIEYIIDYLNIPIENTYAFGDGHNDIEMLKRVSTGVAMGNSVDDLKKVANYITSDIFDGGIQKAMEKYKLI